MNIEEVIRQSKVEPDYIEQLGICVTLAGLVHIAICKCLVDDGLKASSDKKEFDLITDLLRKTSGNKEFLDLVKSEFSDNTFIDDYEFWIKRRNAIIHSFPPFTEEISKGGFLYVDKDYLAKYGEIPVITKQVIDDFNALSEKILNNLSNCLKAKGADK